MSPDTFLHDLMKPVHTGRKVPERDWKALEVHLDLLLHTRESGIIPVVLHANNLKQMYEKRLASEQTRWWVAAAGILPMDQPEAFLKNIEKWHTAILMLASQISSEGSTGSSGGNQLKDQQK
jgi:hypothetical protein